MENLEEQFACEREESNDIFLRTSDIVKQQGRKLQFQATILMLAFLALVYLLIFGGNLRMVLKALSENCSQAAFMSIAFLGFGYCAKRLGFTEFFIQVGEDRIIYHSPPRYEVILFEDIKEIQGFYWGTDSKSDPELTFAIVITLNNERDITISSLQNIEKAWKFLLARIPQKMTFFEGKQYWSSSSAITTTKVLRCMGFGFIWGAFCYFTFSEDLGVVVMLLGLIVAPLPYLIGYFQLGRPVTEDILALVALALQLCFTIALFMTFVFGS